MRRISLAAVFATGWVCLAGPALADDPSAPVRVIEARPQITPMTTKIPDVPLQPILELSGGDMATYWVSPMLQNHDSRVSGVIYKVDGKTQFAKFGFSAVNPAPQPLEVKINCQDRTGAVIAKYDAVLKLAPFGGAIWSAETIPPERSTDLLTKDSDHVWCALSADKPFAAFGTMSLSENGTGHGGTTAINLIAAAR